MTHVLPQIVDGTMMAAFESCPWQWYLHYVLRKRGKKQSDPEFRPSIHLEAGGAFAAGIEAYREGFFLHGYQHEMCMELAALAAMAKWHERLDPFPLEWDSDHLIESKNLVRVIHAIESYFKMYPPGSDLLQPRPMIQRNRTSFEYSFAYPLEGPNWPKHPSGEPFIYAGKCDTLGIWDGHLDVFSDEKTTKGIGKKWPSQWPLRYQFIGYKRILNRLGIPVKAGIIRGIAILKEDIKHATLTQIYPDWLCDQWEMELQGALHDMVNFYEHDSWPRRGFGSGACTAYDGCQFSPVCLASPQSFNGIINTYGDNDWVPGVPNETPHVIELRRAA